MPGKPKILILGDSISNGYLPHVQNLLKDSYDVVRQEGNRANTASMLADLESHLAKDGDAILIHFNFGLHDLLVEHSKGTHRVELAHYRQNLAKIVERLQATGKKLIWATTTPVIYSRHRVGKDWHRKQAYVEAYNNAALEIVRRAGIAVDDLHAVICAAGMEKCLCEEDGVHMNPEAYQILAKAVAEAILSCMNLG